MTVYLGLRTPLASLWHTAYLNSFSFSTGSDRSSSLHCSEAEKASFSSRQINIHEAARYHCRNCCTICKSSFPNGLTSLSELKSSLSKVGSPSSSTSTPEKQCCGSGSGIRGLFDPLDPGSRIRIPNPDPG